MPVYKFRSGLIAVTSPEAGTFLVGETENYLIQGEVFVRLCPQIDGHRSVGQIVEALRGMLSEAEVIYGIDWLCNRGYLVPAVAVDGAAAPALAVKVQALDGIDPGPFIEALRCAGLTAVDRGDVTVVLAGDYLAAGLEPLNRALLADGNPWLPVKAGGDGAWVGPLFNPGGGPCWACLAARLRANRPVRAFLERRSLWPATASVVPPWSAAAQALAAGLAAHILGQWAAGERGAAVTGTLYTVAGSETVVGRHAVLRRSQCPACGTPPRPASGEPARIELRPGLRRVADDGGHRTNTPEQTFQRLRGHVSPVTGILSSLGPLPGRQALTPVYAATFPVTPDIETPSFDDFHRSALGKGKTAEQARASALCEALERWCAIAQGDEPRLRAAYRGIAHEAIPPAALLNFSERQYDERQAWNQAVADPRRHVPVPGRDDLVIDWVAAWSLTQGCRRLVPAAHCYSHLGLPAAEAVCIFNPNGQAAGNCLEEAILQGFLELVERDSVALWWYSRALRPAVELDGFDDPYIAALRAHYRAMGWRLWALDITTDLGIPAFAALAAADAGERICLGFGCHLDAQVALLRALTEVNQLFDLDPARALPWSGGPLERDDFLHPAAALGTRSRQDFAVPCSDDLREEILYCVERARGLGLEVLVLDLTRPDAELAVAKVMVPGLRHFWPRFGPGRLYEVPAALGWVPTPLTEADLNPAHLFL